MNARKGFTLTELLIALAVVAAIAAIALPGFSKARERTAARQAADYLRTIATAERVYYAKWKTYLPVNTGNAAERLASIRNGLGADIRSRDFDFRVDTSATAFTATASRGGAAANSISLNSSDVWTASGTEQKYKPHG